jgi:hypothetical protein
VELSFITNDVASACSAEEAGVDRIFIDLERLGKAARQTGQSLFCSSHTVEDIPRIKKALRRSRLMVRVDPPHQGSSEQVRRVIDLGADYVMLPYFERLGHAQDFVACVGDRAVPVLLLERAAVIATLPDLCRLSADVEMHVGLNDLSRSLGRRHWFDVLADPALAGICATLRATRTPFGFGGIANLSRRDLPVDPESVLAEQVRQGATRGWLSRAFRDTPPAELGREVARLRQAIAFWTAAPEKDGAVIRARLLRQIASLQDKSPGTAAH